MMSDDSEDCCLDTAHAAGEPGEHGFEKARQNIRRRRITVQGSVITDGCSDVEIDNPERRHEQDGEDFLSNGGESSDACTATSRVKNTTDKNHIHNSRSRALPHDAFNGQRQHDTIRQWLDRFREATRGMTPEDRLPYRVILEVVIELKQRWRTNESLPCLISCSVRPSEVDAWCYIVKYTTVKKDLVVAPESAQVVHDLLPRYRAWIDRATTSPRVKGEVQNFDEADQNTDDSYRIDWDNAAQDHIRNIDANPSERPERSLIKAQLSSKASTKKRKRSPTGAQQLESRGPIGRGKRQNARLTVISDESSSDEHEQPAEINHSCHATQAPLQKTKDKSRVKSTVLGHLAFGSHRGTYRTSILFDCADVRKWEAVCTTVGEVISQESRAIVAETLTVRNVLERIPSFDTLFAVDLIMDGPISKEAVWAWAVTTDGKAPCLQNESVQTHFSNYRAWFANAPTIHVGATFKKVAAFIGAVKAQPELIAQSKLDLKDLRDITEQYVLECQTRFAETGRMTKYPKCLIKSLKKDSLLQATPAQCLVVALTADNPSSTWLNNALPGMKEMAVWASNVLPEVAPTAEMSELDTLVERKEIDGGWHADTQGERRTSQEA